ncbi:hypothetical protein P153DRAFT_387907 [Dothidotthia symphoricarpi CBS 119687]|uniref:Uncharacterized protein n=1 Tax=Dothidotthia symphoricarpi CBS 119687 TaxID=1392245 RepID=A0A6A6A856_9PLEO|nr:uncharacterized protein P153DRAFT_387907 [Dothidotthia symphoricarpi CBS 119687]KAF2127363.1 hypothetical protein P153DRAFT_387907 [Dothidotthia symphoricarpi CBS 119687]
MQNRHTRYSPYPEPRQHNNRCPSCLEKGDAILVSPGKPCSQCGNLTPSPEVSPAPQTSRKKRHDRVLFSRQTLVTTSSSQVAKSDREAGRRYDQTLVFSLLENELLSLNPSLPQTARPRQSHPQGGLKELKGNNVSGDIKKYSNVEPLRYGKIDNLEAAVWVIRDSTTVIEDVIRERARLRDDAEKLMKEGADAERVRRFMFERIVQDDWSERVEESKLKRGGSDCIRPSQSDTLLR